MASADVHNTVVIVPTASPVGTVKVKLLERLLATSPFPVVVGFDSRYLRTASLTENAALAARRGLDALVAVVQEAEARGRRDVQVVSMSDSDLRSRFSHRIANFNGRSLDSPAKLWALHWFAASRFEQMWHLEDDTWSHDFAVFAQRYENFTADLIIRGYTTHPFWVRDGWRVGSHSHVVPEGRFCFASLAAYRASRSFARATLQLLRDERRNSTHHELYLPFVVSQQKSLTWAPLLPSHEVPFNSNRLDQFRPLCALQHAELYHPVKSECGAVEDYNLDMPACGGCAGGLHPARLETQSWRACRALCDEHNAQVHKKRATSNTTCTGWVFNSDQACYLKGGNIKWLREQPWRGRTWSGTPSSASELWYDPIF